MRGGSEAAMVLGNVYTVRTPGECVVFELPRKFTTCQRQQRVHINRGSFARYRPLKVLEEIVSGIEALFYVLMLFDPRQPRAFLR